MDSDLRRLERTDPQAARRLKIRMGLPVALQPGDHVLVQETESPWAHTPWHGIIVHEFPNGDCYAKPVDYDAVTWRVRPTREYCERGVYLTRNDITTIQRGSQ